MPPGGPRDTTGPEVVETIPETGSIQVDRETEPAITFSENIKMAKPEESVFITPFPGDEVEYKVKGKRIEIEIPGLLRENRTYVITCGTKITDYRNNNLSESYSLAFSTGGRIDMGKIRGRVHAQKKASGIDVWAYTGTVIDTLDPQKNKPDYIVQCSENGEFQFTHLAPGSYRLFAVEDRYGDQVYQPVEDRYGVFWEDIEVGADSGAAVLGVLFRMTTEDTLAPALNRAEARDRKRIFLQFSEPVVTDSLYRIELYNEKNEKIPVNFSYQDPLRDQLLHCVGGPFSKNNTYTLSISGVADKDGNRIDTAFNSVEFSGVSTPDTTAPVLSSSVPEPGSEHVMPGTSLYFYFSEPVDRVAGKQHIVLEDTLGKVYPGSVIRESPASFIYTPFPELDSETFYRCRISSLEDLRGNKLADTTVTFMTLNKDTLTGIAGVVNDADTAARGSIFISAHQADNQDVSYEVEIADTGRFAVSSMLPGRYILSFFRDRDGDGHYSFGDLSPFSPAERFRVYEDTLQLRSRWVQEGIKLLLK